MTAKHTPGPWAVSDDGTITARHLGLVTHLSDTTEANYRLIAAAPDLLWALEKMLREHDALQMAERKTDDRWPAATYARATIAKVRGE